MMETLDQIALLPCPFCGAEPLLVEHPAHKHLFVDLPDSAGSWTIECFSCSCGMIHETKAEAVESWNRRLVDELAKQKPVATVVKLASRNANGPKIDWHVGATVSVGMELFAAPVPESKGME